MAYRKQVGIATLIHVSLSHRSNRLDDAIQDYASKNKETLFLIIFIAYFYFDQKKQKYSIWYCVKPIFSGCVPLSLRIENDGALSSNPVIKGERDIKEPAINIYIHTLVRVTYTHRHTRV